MKISIITEGFSKTGYGHITRCLSLYQAFEKKYILPTLYINGDDNVRSLLPNTNYKIIDWAAHPTKLIGEIKNSDIVIIDSYLVGKDFYENISKHAKVSLFIDDNIRIDYSDGIILNGTINAETFPYKKKPGKEFLLGTKYIPLRKEFWNAVNRKFNKELSSILITFGATDSQNLTCSVLKSLHENFPAIKKKVVVGSGFINKDEIEKLRDINTELFYSPSALLMRELMLFSDIAITAAGQTLYELAATGTPSIAIAVAENQKNNILEWKRKGFLLNTIYHNDVNFIRRIIEQFQTLQSISVRKKLSGIGVNNVDGQGSIRVVNYLIDKVCNSYGFYLRSAAEVDSQKVFDLSNDPAVRSQSITSDTIELGDHKKWFSEKIKKEDYIFLLAFDKKNNFMGQVRFDIKKVDAVVSISIVNEFRGKGFSKNILKEACTKIFSEKDISTITAYILPDNIASINGFKSAGFIKSDESIINEKRFLKFILNKK
ncbi:MAG: bifunctional UDP-2,4-diacetamido-2,4,6-trideoxy-beta-L-altropyranose hydrolase/GNAT family N-acetyltransferase [Ignavibacteriales bacterium]|nr:bifunctional UDP-2,4-diacetamido-2,4,6-trideoxy-beta-L-altropyranose hydrolase/GNAT family N-acetyltransferase [Ignavibacteriales bacterium]